MTAAIELHAEGMTTAAQLALIADTPVGFLMLLLIVVLALFVLDFAVLAAERRGDCPHCDDAADEIAELNAEISRLRSQDGRADPSSALRDTLAEIERQCNQADDPEHHTLGLVKNIARAALSDTGETHGDARL